MLSDVISFFCGWNNYFHYKSIQIILRSLLLFSLDLDDPLHSITGGFRPVAAPHL